MKDQKNKFKRIPLLIVLAMVFSFFGVSKTQAALDNSNVISDYNFTNAAPMSANEINEFLRAKGSKYTDYVIPEYVDVPYPLAAGGLATVAVRQTYDAIGAVFYGKTVAQLIYEESTAHNVNPRVMLATLQKESSAITGDVFRSSTVAAWPLFYMYDETMAGCLYSGTDCNDSYYRQLSIDYGGVGQQIGYATAWFGLKYSQYKSTGRPIKSGSTIVGYEQYSDMVSIDGQNINCQTAGSRILYLYTPHIQTSFYNIFSDFFGDPAAGPPPPPPPPANDTTPVSIRSYNGSYSFSGVKIPASRAYFGETLIADLNTTAWNISFENAVGTTDYAVIFKDEAGAEINRKPITIIRHKTADINGDNTVDITDLAIFAENWGKANPPEAMADMDASGAVDITDFAIFAENWGR